MDNWVVVAISVVAVVLMTVALAVVDFRMLPAAPMAQSLLVSVAAVVPAVVTWLVAEPLIAPGITGDLFLPLAVLAGMAAFLATIALRSVGSTVLATVLFSFAWTLLVYVPVALMIFAPLGGLLGLQPIDHGGALAVNVAAGAAAFGVLVTSGPRRARERSGALPMRVGVIAVAVLAVSWVVWLAGSELAVDDLTPGILLNGVVGALAGVGGWVVAQRIRHQVTTLSAVAAGLVSGLVSVTAAAPLFTPVSAAVTGVVAGAAACIFTYRRVEASRRQQWFIVGSHLVAGGVGLVMLALLATGLGFLFTGQLVLIRDQILSVLVVGIWSGGVAAGLWFVLRRLAMREPAR